jgi:hypothetical protein
MEGKYSSGPGGTQTRERARCRAFAKPGADNIAAPYMTTKLRMRLHPTLSKVSLAQLRTPACTLRIVKKELDMVSFHAADNFSVLGMVLGVIVMPIAILGMLFVLARALLGV